MMVKRFLSLVTLTTIFAAAFAVAAPAAGATAATESDFLSRLNAERTERGLAALSSKSDLVTVARRHSGRMADAEDIWHNENLANEVGGGWTMLGENVGMGGNVPGLHQAFMQSESHRKNILERRFNQVGIGVQTRDDVIYVTVVFAERGVAKPAVSKKDPAPAKTKAAATAPRTRTQTASAPAAPAASAPEAAPEPETAPARTVPVLVRMASMDAADGGESEGLALGN